MRKVFKVLSTALALALVTLFAAGIIGSVEIQAASKKTVRVLNQAELNKALKNSKVGTIILRTSSYDKITINSNKAKKKKIIIDAPSVVVENKSKFKSIEIQSAATYIENVSGNSITYLYSDYFIIADGKKVKKLTMKTFDTDYIVGKDASITTLQYDINGKKSSVDKKTGNLKVTCTFSIGDNWDYEEVDVVYDIVLDGSGRITGFSYKNPEDGMVYKTDVKYDKYGNFTEVKEADANGKVIRKRTYEYDKNHNMTLLKNDEDGSSFTSSYVYDSQGRYTSVGYESEYYNIKNTFEYDSNGRKTGMTTYSEYLYPGYEYVTEYTTVNTYDKNGFILSVNEDYTDGHKCTQTYEYDKSGNNTYSCRTEIMADGNTVKYEYKYTYDKYGELKESFMKFPGENEWTNMDELGD